MKEEKKERIKQLVKKLAEFSDEQRELIAQKFGIRNPEGHLLSGRNMVLLYLQAVDKPLSVVAGFRQWLRYNRVVKKGEKGYLIAVPSIKNSAEDDRQNPDDETADDPAFYMYKAVFDISQTEELTNTTKCTASRGKEILENA